MNPRCRRLKSASSSAERPLALSPAMVTEPEVGDRMQPRMERRVVFPLPDGPISSVNSPG